MASSLGCDELVKSITLYRPKHWLFHGYVFPFILLYMTHFYWWIYICGYEEYFEIAMILLSVIGIVQILTGLCCFWSVHVRCFLTCSKVHDPFKAKLVKVVPTPNNGSSELLLLNRIQESSSGEIALWFEFQKIKYVYDAGEKKRFETIDFPTSELLEYYYDWKGYQVDTEIIAAEQKFGKNHLIMVIPEFMELFLERATAPFFVFQVFCVGLWCLDEYWYYSLFTLMMLVAFECILVHQQIRNMAEIRKMGNKPFLIQVFRNRRWRGMMTDELVPGDIVSVGRSQNDKLVPCDLLLLKGPCIVDESMLTGESVPQMKEPIENVERIRNLNIETDGKLHILFGGTKIVQHSSPPKIGNGLKGPDGGCVAYVLRTGFHTSQGKLLRTILFGVKRVTANNKEAFAFILFLLVFALAAASYVWIKGTEDPDRNQYKLFLECALIITTVVPPELPVELSLAVNTSLGSLAKLGVYCTEPFRIPFAGKIGLCCFDKTGTLTSDDLVVEGVAGLSNDTEVTEISQIPLETIQVLSTCHSLVQLNDGIVGDPLEKTTLTAVQWNLTKGDAVVPQKGKHPGLKIFHRFHFTSALKRMSVIAGFSDPNSNETIYFGAMKGAPETLRSMYSSVPQYYDQVYLKMTRRGARVLALGRKHLGKLAHQQVRDITREALESEMTFAGFVVISCPLKPDSKSVIKEILNSTHEVIIITGDNPLTACHVANELRFTRKPKTLILTEGAGCWEWVSVDETVKMGLIPDLPCTEFVKIFDLCITGEGLSYLNEHHHSFLFSIVPFVRVFARVAPKQKELVITTLKRKGYSVLMCGDGTNDVGALKHADVGVAILSSDHFESSMKTHDLALGDETRARQTSFLTSQSKPSKKLQNTSRRTTSQSKMKSGREANDPQNQIKSLLKELEEQEANQIVKLGDASIAAPFTSKLSSIVSVCHIIKQGRCTLVTTLQMFKILALNALIMAYCQSVLYLEGIKFSDTQATLQGLLLAGCFLFISKSKPLKHLSKERPLPNIFNMYTIATVLLQFVVHFGSLLFLVHKAMELSPIDKASKKTDAEEKFEPNLINSTVYIISVALQIATFAINYRGHPFMESMFENKHLMYSLLWSAIGVLILALGIVPDLSNQFEIIIFPPDFRMILLTVLFGDFVMALVIDRLLLYILGEGRLAIE